MAASSTIFFGGYSGIRRRLQNIPFEVRLSGDEKTLIVSNWAGRDAKKEEETGESADPTWVQAASGGGSGRNGSVLVSGVTTSQCSAASPWRIPATRGAFLVQRADLLLLNPDGTANGEYFKRWTTPETLDRRFYLSGALFWTFKVPVHEEIRIRELRLLRLR